MKTGLLHLLYTLYFILLYFILYTRAQALLHLFAMKTAVDMAREEMGPEKLSEVVEFHRRERLREMKEEAQAQAAEEGDWMASAMAMWTTPFLPNLLNTCVFLVETSQCIAVLLVNYKGRPWMKVATHACYLLVCAVPCPKCARAHSAAPFLCASTLSMRSTYLILYA